MIIIGCIALGVAVVVLERLRSRNEQAFASWVNDACHRLDEMPVIHRPQHHRGFYESPEDRQARLEGERAEERRLYRHVAFDALTLRCLVCDVTVEATKATPIICVPSLPEHHR